MVSGLSPKNAVTGFATQVAKEPLIENTTMMANTCQFDVSPQRSLSFSMIEFDRKSTIS